MPFQFLYQSIVLTHQSLGNFCNGNELGLDWQIIEPLRSLQNAIRESPDKKDYKRIYYVSHAKLHLTASDLNLKKDSLEIQGLSSKLLLRVPLFRNEVEKYMANFSTVFDDIFYFPR